MGGASGLRARELAAPDARTLPAIFTPDGADSSASALRRRIESDRSRWTDELRHHGALLFRGFAVHEAAALEEVALALDPELGSEYLGTSPRAGLTRHVFSASELPGYYPIPQHCEMTFVRDPPKRIFFGCLVEPRRGSGETPIADFQRVHEELDPEVRSRFESRGLRIIRNYDGPATPKRLDLWKLKRWDEMFQTRDRDLVTEKCKAQGFEPIWLGEDRLRILSTQPASARHPETGAWVWFNHVQVFHDGSAPAEYRRILSMRPGLQLAGLWMFSRVMVALKRRSPAEERSMHMTYADGAEIPEADLEHVRDAIWRNLVALPWHRGDVLIIDNRRVSHGRLPYRGARQIVVAWS